MINKDNPIKSPKFHHVNLRTNRQDEMVDWYTRVLRCQVNFQVPGIAFLTNDKANHRIALVSADLFKDDPDRVYRAGLHHTAFEYDSLDDMLADYLRLADEGVLPSVTVDHGLTTSFYYRDPDGNMLELQSDNFGDWEKSTEFMRNSQDFLNNPIGQMVDPHKMIADRNHGVSVEDVHRKAYAGEYPPSEKGTFFFPEEMEAEMFV